MFAINFNFPYRKKDGSLITMEKALDGAGADLDLIDLDDVAITNPTEGDGLIYDNTAHKWKNIPIISRILTLFNAWKKNGAYNLCPNNGTTQVTGEVTWTVNSDGTVSATVASTTSQNRSITIYSGAALNVSGLKAVGTPTTEDAKMTVTYSDNTTADETGNGLTLGSNVKTVILTVKSGTTAQTIVFKPMITTDLNATYDDYVPYAMTNRELTEIVDQYYTETASMDSTYIDTGDSMITLRKWGRMVYLYAQLKTKSSLSVDTPANIATIPTGYKPKFIYNGTTYDTGSNNTAEHHDINLETNGNVKLTIRNSHNTARWVCASCTYICE